MKERHPGVVALGFSEAAMYLRAAAGESVKAIISIHGEREFGVEGQVPSRLDLFFDDVAAPDPADPIACYHARMRSAADVENGLIRTPPSVEDARKILQFANSIRSFEGVVLCHCGGGVSRSPAAALLCLSVWAGSGGERYCVDYIRRIRPCAAPHEDLVRFCDELLGRGGALLRELQGRHGSDELR